MYHHRRHQTCIVNLNPNYRISHDQPPPLLVNRRTIRKQDAQPLEKPHPSINLGDAEAEATAGRDWPSADAPKLSHILRGEAELLVSCNEDAQRISN